jgi:ABC-type transporter Mla maintaining outer membrane lipid asymmetry ATPase subunit MlaF
LAAIVVTHDIHASKEFADRFVMLDEGAIVAEGSMPELGHSSNQFVRQFLQRSK